MHIYIPTGVTTQFPKNIVLLKLKADTTDQQLADLSSALSSMKDKIPGIFEVTQGVNNSPEGKSQGFSYGFIVRFKDYI